jgi:SRSO17 transposase
MTIRHEREVELIRWVDAYLRKLSNLNLLGRVAEHLHWFEPYLLDLNQPGTSQDREAELARWLEPALSSIVHPTRKFICLSYIMSLLQVGTRKCLQKISATIPPATYDQVKQFIDGLHWDESRLEDEVVNRANMIRGGPGAILVVHDIALLKKGVHSVGVSRQHSPRFGKEANCQTLISFTLCRDEIPTPFAIRLFLPKEWLQNAKRMDRAGVPEDFRISRKKPTVALYELKHIVAAGVNFDVVVADIHYGIDRSFRRRLTRLGLYWAVEIGWAQFVYPADVELIEPGAIRYPKHPTPIPNVDSRTAYAWLKASSLRPMQCPSSDGQNATALFAAQRIRIADGPRVATYEGYSQNLPGDEFWLLGALYGSGSPIFYLSNLPPETPREQLELIVRTHIATHTACNQLKYDLGLGDFEGRSWRGLHFHALMGLIAYQFLQQERTPKSR